MNLIKANYTILTDFQHSDFLNLIELAGRTCYKSEAKMGLVECPHFKEWREKNTTEFEPICPCVQNTVECPYTDNEREFPCSSYSSNGEFKIPSYIPFIKMLIDKGHESVLEHRVITVRFVVDRGVSHEMVRHRLSSFSQESTRYCNYGKNEHINFILPVWCTDLGEGIYDSERFQHETISAASALFLNACAFSEEIYNKLVNVEKWLPQQARAILPNALKTEIVVTANLRSWRTIFSQRCSPAAHPQMREVMIPLLKEFKSKIPIIFDDIMGD